MSQNKCMENPVLCQSKFIPCVLSENHRKIMKMLTAELSGSLAEVHRRETLSSY